MKNVAIVLIIISVLVVAYFLLRSEAPPPAPHVRDDVTLRATDAGAVVGFIDRHGARAWLGVPFAAPPVGELRWQPPRPPAPWQGVREALEIGPVCPQFASLLSGAGLNPPAGQIDGREDCLYLNVWSPANAIDLPVMVWIHGGGNTIGHAGSYNGARLATAQNVVVVTINYRLAHLGWFAHPALATGDPAADSGNFGTLDIIRALEWTRDNIAKFGGNPDNVTLFGESAGAANTLAMAVSPLARDLFHRGISQSGGLFLTPREWATGEAEAPWPVTGAMDIVDRLLVADGSAPDTAAARERQAAMSPADLRDYLYGKSAEELLRIFDGGFFGMINTPANIADGYVLPAESDAEALLSDPTRYNGVPLILGTNRDEPSLFMMANPEYVDRFLWIFSRFKDRDRYLRAVRYGALAWKERGVDSIARHLTSAGHRNVYAYRFDWDEEPTVLGFDLSDALGAAHGLEIPFVFGEFGRGIGSMYIYDASDDKELLARQMMSYWTQFAYTGDPGTGREGELPSWLPWGSNGKTSLVLDTPSDQGIYMMSDEVTVEGIKRALAEDPDITEQEERCRLYVQTFRRAGFDRAEYEQFGPDGCAAFDPDGFARF